MDWIAVAQDRQVACCFEKGDELCVCIKRA